MWQYYVFRIAGATLGRMPMWAGYLIVGLIADIVYLLSPEKRAATTANIRRVLGPDTDEATVKRTARNIIRSMARNYCDFVGMAHMKVHDFTKVLNINGEENFRAAMERGKGVILVTAHIGSFDMGLQWLAAHNVKTTILVEELEPPEVFKYVNALREKNGLVCVPVQRSVLKSIMQALHRGEVVLLTCDRDFGNDGLKTLFFGEETTMPIGAVRIAMRTGAAIVPVFCLRGDDGYFDVFFEPAVDIVPGGRDQIAQNVDMVIKVLERYIRMYPEQWVVMSHIWPDGQDDSGGV